MEKRDISNMIVCIMLLPNRKQSIADPAKTIAQYIPLLSFTPVKVSLQLTMMLMQRIQFQYVD